MTDTAPRAPLDLEPEFNDWATDLAAERENAGFDNYAAMIEEALRKAFRAGLAEVEALRAAAATEERIRTRQAIAEEAARQILVDERDALRAELATWRERSIYPAASLSASQEPDS